MSKLTEITIKPVGRASFTVRDNDKFKVCIVGLATVTRQWGFVGRWAESTNWNVIVACPLLADKLKALADEIELLLADSILEADSPFDEYVRLLCALHELISAGQGDSEQADAIREAMDRPWHLLSSAEISRADWLSEDLYSLDATSARAAASEQKAVTEKAAAETS